MWSSKDLGDSYRQVYVLNSGSLLAVGCDGSGRCPVRRAFTVRCVLDLREDVIYPIQLCDTGISSSYGAARCGTLDDGCKGGGSCWVNHVWSSSSLGSSYYRVYALASGGFGSGACDGHGKCFASSAFSLRCLLLALYRHRVRSHPYHPRLRCAVSWI